MQPDVLRCPVCHEARLSADADGVQCESCGAAFPVVQRIPVLVCDPARLERDIEAARRINPAWYEVEQPPEIASPWKHHLRKRREYVEKVLARELSRRGRDRAERLIDLGCGDGNNLGWLSRFAERIYGSDYNFIRLARAQARATGATLFIGDILDLPVSDCSFDVVFFNHVIEHIPDDLSALRTIVRILAPGGIVIIGTPNEGAWWWQLAYRRAPEVRASTDHVHFYTADDIAGKMRADGLELIEVEHMGWGPPDWHLDGRIRKYKFVDDAFEFVGRRFMPHQASSLYLVATLPGTPR